MMSCAISSPRALPAGDILSGTAIAAAAMQMFRP